LHYLAYRSRSEAEIRSYLLRRGYQPDVGDRVLKKLRSLNYVDDESFARNWAVAKAQSRGYGPKRIEQELTTKGIVPSVIREVIRETLDHREEKTQAKKLLAKRFQREDFRDPKTLRRAIAFLQHRGYSDQVISDLLRDANGED
jgi:regulatory protein